MKTKSGLPIRGIPRDGIWLEEFKGEAEIVVEPEFSDPFIFAVDIYSFQPQTHPENHLGWWHFNFSAGCHRLRLDFDFRAKSGSPLKLSLDGEPLEAVNGWVNAAYSLVPLMECKLVFWNEKNEILFLRRLLIKCKDSGVLERFYQRHHEEDSYSPELPFLDLLHHFKLRILKRYFKKYFRGRVLDVGCGLSLFTAFKEKWPFRITAGDVVFARMKEGKAGHPEMDWVVFDACALPFKDGIFDALFAGEILEHLPDSEAAVREWNRVQKRGGILVVTTPNRRRRINVLNDQDWPISPDHLRELSFEDLNRIVLPGGGYRVLKGRWIYLELWAKRRWWYEDYLQREGNSLKNSRLMRLLFRLGYHFPKKALSLISLAKKI
jgi:ubiquinone/menaquinone biosynthesis C-methylase UbiE